MLPEPKEFELSDLPGDGQTDCAGTAVVFSQGRPDEERKVSESVNISVSYMKFLKKHLITIILSLIFLVGLGLLVYPTFADYWNSMHQYHAILDYAEEISKMDDEQYEEMLEEARAYNASISEHGINWMLSDEEKKEYQSILSAGPSGIMGYIDISKIDIRLPIYHGTSEDVLQTSIGHLEGSSLPVGGEGSHCALSGHRGLPSAKLFSDLDKLKEGDTFVIGILNETLTYEVDQIRVVEPTDMTELQIKPGKDYCTLVTCTPYGINTHRLLVRGHRTENADGDVRVVADAIQIEPIYIAPFIAVPILVILLLVMMIAPGKKSRKKG